MKNPLVVLNTYRREASYNGKPLSFPHKEFEILLVLARAKGNVITRGQLLKEVWGMDPEEVNIDTRTIDQHVARARRRLRNVGGDSVILTVNSSGYRSDAITLANPEPVLSRIGKVQTIKRFFGKNPGSLLTMFVTDMLPEVEKGSSLTLA